VPCEGKWVAKCIAGLKKLRNTALYYCRWIDQNSIIQSMQRSLHCVSLISYSFERWSDSLCLISRSQEQVAEATAKANEVISNFRTVRAFSNETWEAESYAKLAKKSCEISQVSAKCFYEWAGIFGYLLDVFLQSACQHLICSRIKML